MKEWRARDYKDGDRRSIAAPNRPRIIPGRRPLVLTLRKAYRVAVGSSLRADEVTAREGKGQEQSHGAPGERRAVPRRDAPRPDDSWRLELPRHLRGREASARRPR